MQNVLQSILNGLGVVLIRWPYRWRWWLTMIILIGGSAATLAIPRIDILDFERGSDEILGLSLGLDLVGGIHLVYQVEEDFEPTEEQMEGLVTIINQRVGQLGVIEPSVQQFGDRRLIVQLPGLEDEERAREVISGTAQLEIIERVCSGSPCNENSPENTDDRPTGLTGEDMTEAYPGTDQVTGRPILIFELNQSAAGDFGTLTQRIYNTLGSAYPNQLAFKLDDRTLVSAVVQSPILTGVGQISGEFTIEEVRDLAIQIESGRLPVPIEEISSDFVAASLGANSLEQALEAGIIGLLLVMGFMVAYYRMSGVIAALALVLYTAIVLALFKLIPVTLTLAGLAAFILSLGMAVDANILIFERMKEEIRAGRALNFATQIGFNRAWSSIRDGNISTLLIAAVLYFFGNAGANSQITGFAIVLAIGVGTSMFTALVISKKVLSLVIGTQLRRYPRAFSPEGYRPRTAAAERGE